MKNDDDSLSPSPGALFILFYSFSLACLLPCQGSFFANHWSLNVGIPACWTVYVDDGSDMSRIMDGLRKLAHLRISKAF